MLDDHPRVGPRSKVIDCHHQSACPLRGGTKKNTGTEAAKQMRLSAETGRGRPPVVLTSCSQSLQDSAATNQHWSGGGSRSLSPFSEEELSFDSLTEPNHADKAEEASGRRCPPPGVLPVSVSAAARFLPLQSVKSDLRPGAAAEPNRPVSCRSSAPTNGSDLERKPRSSRAGLVEETLLMPPGSAQLPRSFETNYIRPRK